MKLEVKDLPNADLLSPEEIAELLPKLDDIVKWAKQVQEFALNQALSGVRFEGFKVVEGRSIRKFTNETQVVDTLLGEGYDESIIYERKLITLTQMESMLGKNKFQELLGHLVDKPAGKPTLVPADDKRPEFNPDAAAAADFE